MALPEKPDAAFPLVVAVGGLDPRGAAGLVRDFLTIRARGARPFLIPTAYTLQTAGSVSTVAIRSEDELRQSLRVALGGGGNEAAAVKVGMVGVAALVAVLVEGLSGFAGPVVHDPVLAAGNGGSLFAGPPGALGPLIARATLVTPNLAEAQALTGVEVKDVAGARAAAERLLAMGARAVLVKGGHLAGAAAADLLVTAEGEELFALPRVPGKDPRGTGCALASAIAVELGRGAALSQAVAVAKQWLHEQIAAATAVAGEHWL